MPPTAQAVGAQLMQSIAAGINGVRSMVSQQDTVITNQASQVTMHDGQLLQYPESGDNYTTGYGYEILSNGLGSAPVLRAGLLTWQNPTHGGLVIAGMVQCDTNGYVRAVYSAEGLVTYDTSGNVVATIFSI